MYKQLEKEARWAILLTLLYLLGWVGFAYFSPQGRGILGFPIWFELSCILLPVIFTLVAIVVVKKVYKNIDLEVNHE
ncbi:DUF997 family protein [Mannheimia varigena]|uniref:Membrane protein n=1 Tax=Mannheimia varigena USDA-ARS-USMARC-1296 TaxID=1433287 RepID=W0QC17_9PAST|nr:DUF997 family protein [Mannheimia varigena]AHG76439.1 membrane protein [Mannheimia varigena USDA-ARS-USMARC-1296]AHG78434.1 membrane protein [Mannheimia varigena USDA-ARS-USMARC-1312]AHG78820.1 membrane protein [Mannheimia varigena USDA-ARS-USMARC-1388]AWW33558.1 DUF997 family protein [Mannheimia varigena]MDY2946582.1 DUF997 family protein [Mannheimia varigena]